MNNSFINFIRFNFLYIDYYTFGKSWVYPEDYLPYSMLRYINQGEAVFVIDGVENKVSEGNVVYIPVGSRLSCHALDDEFSFYSIRFATSVNYDGGDLLSDYFGVPTIMNDKNNEVKAYFEEMYHWVRSDVYSRMFRVRGYLELIIAFIIEQGSISNSIVDFNKNNSSMDTIRKHTKKNEVKLDTRVQNVVDYIVLHPTEQYSVLKMSEIAGLSESRFRTLFKKQVGKNPLDYLNEIKVMTAARKLLMSSDNISDIAYQVGYEDPNYFSRIFKKYFCITPKQYRDNAKE